MSMNDDYARRAIEYYTQEHGTFDMNNIEHVFRINELLFNDMRFMDPERLKLYQSLERLKRGTEFLNMMSIVIGLMSLFVFAFLMSSVLLK